MLSTSLEYLVLLLRKCTCIQIVMYQYLISLVNGKFCYFVADFALIFPQIIVSKSISKPFA